MRVGNPGGKFSNKIVPGAKFNNLTVIRRLPTSKRGRKNVHKVLCRCVCGEVCSPEVANLLGGNSKSCGCLRKKAKGSSGKRSLVIPGFRKGRLLVLARIMKQGKLTNKVKCKCDCGVVCQKGVDKLVYDDCPSCGCLHLERLAKVTRDRSKFKGFSGRFPRTFLRWKSMIARCYNKKQKSYPDYGAKGVVVCEYLRESPWNLKELIGLSKPPKHSLDRFPVHDGNYTCGECDECIDKGWKLNIRWASRREQSANRGDFNFLVTAFGETKTSTEWAKATGMNGESIRRRIRRGWTAERALSTPDKLGHCYNV